MAEPSCARKETVDIEGMVTEKSCNLSITSRPRS